jgi:hypothetical protein
VVLHRHPSGNAAPEVTARSCKAHTNKLTAASVYNDTFLLIASQSNNYSKNNTREKIEYKEPKQTEITIVCTFNDHSSVPSSTALILRQMIGK